MQKSTHNIEHVFVIMLENRSFDNMLGLADIPGVPPITGYSNSYTYNGAVHKYPVTDTAPTAMSTDPGHELLDVLQQLTNSLPKDFMWPMGPYPYQKFPKDFPNQTGFVSNYVDNNDEDNPGPPLPEKYGDIMKGFNKSQAPILSQLGKEFAVCTRWHSSIPGPTWPNRFFVHLASSNGLDCTPTNLQIAEWMVCGFRSKKGSIFQAMEKKGIRYRIYNDYVSYHNHNSAFSDDPNNGLGIEGLGWIPQVQVMEGIGYDSSYELKEYFPNHVNGHYPFAYTFIEPHYGNLIHDNYGGGSSQHPMDDIYGGEALVKFVYETLRNSPLWEKSLLIITYDEHGGFYDSVAPPQAPPPNDGSLLYGKKGSLSKFGFEFDRYGVRVPAIVVSPFIAKNTVESSELYDHTSVLATLEKLFHLDPLTDRDEKAATVLNLLTLDAPRQDCPTHLDALPAPGPKTKLTLAEVEAKEQEPLPETGNLIGAMGVLMKLHYEVSPKYPWTRWILRSRIRKIKTKGDLKLYAREVALKIAKKKAELKH